MNDSYLLALTIFGTLLLVMFVFIIGSFMIIHKQRQQQAKDRARDQEQRFRNELLQARLEVQEQSLNMISKEIHDNIGQVLSMVKMQLFQATRAEDAATGRSISSNALEMLGGAINELRNLSHALNGEMVSRLGIIAALQKELSFANSLYPVQGSLVVSGEEVSLLPDQDLLLFRIAQQAMNNIYRHAAATQYKVNLIFHPGSLEMTICDNGTGFQEAQLEKPSGIGLINMRDRAKMLGGSVHFGNNPEGGAYIRLVLNLN